MTRRWAPPTRCTLRRNTARLTKDLTEKKIKINFIFSKLRQSGLFLRYCDCEQLRSFEKMLQLRRNVGNCVKFDGRKLALTPASWSSGYVLVSGAGGLRFNYRAGIIGHNVANDSPPLGHFFKRSCVGRVAMTQSWAWQTLYTLWRNTATIMKIWFGNWIWDLLFSGEL